MSNINKLKRILLKSLSYLKKGLSFLPKLEINIVENEQQDAAKVDLRKSKNLLIRVFYLFTLPIVVSFLLFSFIARPLRAQITDRNTRLAQYVMQNDLEVATEDYDGKERAYYIFEGEKTYVSPEGINSMQPSVSGEYISYASETGTGSQVFLYYIPSDTTVQVSFSGTNLAPKVSRQGMVVWEGWIEANGQNPANWQLFLYDGKKAFQLTQGDTSQRADIKGNYIVFARRSESGFWRSVAYSIVEGKFSDISSGEESEYPKLESDGTIYYGPPVERQRKYPLKVQDLFILNLGPLSTESMNPEDQATIDEILAQIEQIENTQEVNLATESAQVQGASEENTVLPDDTQVDTATESSNISM